MQTLLTRLENLEKRIDQLCPKYHIGNVLELKDDGSIWAINSEGVSVPYEDIPEDERSGGFVLAPAELELSLPEGESW